MSHTPGPWEMLETGTFPETNHFHGIYSENHPTGRIALVEGFDVTAANARLIRAAPELLDALKDAAETARHYYMLFHDDTWKKRLDHLESAIAKAEEIAV